MDRNRDESRRVVTGPDGIARSRAREEELNDLIHGVFTSLNGKVALDYLRSISTNYVHGPEATDAQIRHREGMRFLVAIIESRIKGHEK